MKVLFLAYWYPQADRPYYGIFVREHAKAVRSAGDEVVVLHVPGEQADTRWLWRMKKESDPTLSEGIPTYHVQCRRVSIPRLGPLSHWISYSIYLWSSVAAFRRLRKMGFRPDVIHAHVWNSGLPAALISRLTGLPFVVTEHSSSFPRRTLSKQALGQARFALERADLVLPVSAELERAIFDYGIKARFKVVPNAVDTSIFYCARRITMAGEPMRMIFVGYLEPTEIQGFDTLVKALVSLRERRTDWRLDVVGDGPSRADYERVVAESGLDGAVAFHGSRPKTAIAAMMRESDLFVLPSRFENLPCVIIEGMTSGLPVVSTAVGGIPELVSERDGVLVPPETPALLADALDRVLSNLTGFDRDEIAARARDRYGLAVVGAQFDAIYESVLASRRKPAVVPGSTEP